MSPRPNYLVLRVDTSPYHGPLFLQKEKEALESLEGITYLDKLPNPDIDVPLVLISNTHTQWDRPELVSLLKSTALILHPNSGYDNFPLNLLDRHKGPIIIGHSIRQNAVVTYILAALLQHYAPIPQQQHWETQRRWERPLLEQKKFLILGAGHIGAAVAQHLHLLGAQYDFFDPYQGYATLAPRAPYDVLILCASLNPDNRHMVDAHFLQQYLQKDYLLINTARGELVKTVDLLDSLKSQPQAFAYLDVFEHEPQDLALFSPLPNVHTTSHIAGVWNHIDERIIAFSKNTLQDFLSDQPPYQVFSDKYRRIDLRYRHRQDFFI